MNNLFIIYTKNLYYVNNTLSIDFISRVKGYSKLLFKKKKKGVIKSDKTEDCEMHRIAGNKIYSISGRIFTS